MDTMLQGSVHLQVQLGPNGGGCPNCTTAAVQLGPTGGGCSEAFPTPHSDIGGCGVSTAALDKGRGRGSEGSAMGLSFGCPSPGCSLERTAKHDVVGKPKSLASSNSDQGEASEYHQDFPLESRALRSTDEKGVECSTGSVPGDVPSRLCKGTCTSRGHTPHALQGASSHPEALQAFGTPRGHHRARRHSHLKGSVSEPIGSGKAAASPSSRLAQHDIVPPRFRLDDSSPAASPTRGLGMPRASRLSLDSMPQQMWDPRPITPHTALGLASLKALMKQTPAKAEGRKDPLRRESSLSLSLASPTPATPATSRNTPEATGQGGPGPFMQGSLSGAVEEGASMKARITRLHRSFGSATDFHAAARLPMCHENLQRDASKGTHTPTQLEVTGTSAAQGLPRSLHGSPCSSSRGSPKGRFDAPKIRDEHTPHEPMAGQRASRPETVGLHKPGSNEALLRSMASDRPRKDQAGVGGLRRSRSGMPTPQAQHASGGGRKHGTEAKCLPKSGPVLGRSRGTRSSIPASHDTGNAQFSPLQRAQHMDLPTVQDTDRTRAATQALFSPDKSQMGLPSEQWQQMRSGKAEPNWMMEGGLGSCVPKHRPTIARGASADLAAEGSALGSDLPSAAPQSRRTCEAPVQAGMHSAVRHWPVDAWARRKLRGRRGSESAVLSDFAVKIKREEAQIEREGLHSVAGYILTPGQEMGRVLEPGQSGIAAERGNVGGMQEPGRGGLESRLPLAGGRRASCSLEEGVWDLAAASCVAVEKVEENKRWHRSRMSLDGSCDRSLSHLPFAERSVELEHPKAGQATEHGTKMGHCSRLRLDDNPGGGLRSPFDVSTEMMPPRPNPAAEQKGRHRSRLTVDAHYEGALRTPLGGLRLHDHVLGQPYEDVRKHFVMHRKVIGEGQFGVIRKCKEIATGDIYACKSIHKSSIRCPEDAEDLRKEVMCLSMLKHHPTVATLHRVFEDQVSLHIVMELCQGGDLLDRIASNGPLAEQDAARLCLSLIEALLHCHCLGIMHRDIKPENILLATPDPQSDIKLVDFGVATFLEREKPLQDIVGTPEYMAPEVIKQSYDKMADIWSAGVVLYVALSGVPPFWASSKESIAEAILGREVSFKSAKWAKVSDECKDLIGQMLQKDPKQRISAPDVLRHPWVQHLVKT